MHLTLDLPPLFILEFLDYFLFQVKFDEIRLFFLLKAVGHCRCLNFILLDLTSAVGVSSGGTPAYVLGRAHAPTPAVSWRVHINLAQVPYSLIPGGV